MTRALHCCLRYFPDRGGSEGYVSALIRGLSRLGVRSVVASVGGSDAEFEHDGVTNHRLAAGRGGEFADRFAALIDRVRPDLVHFHARTAEWSADAVRAARDRGLPTVLTYHIATTSCPRGDMMLYGVGQCDGRLEAGRCGACVAQASGLPRPPPAALARTPAPARAALAWIVPPGRGRTALALPDAVANGIGAIKSYLNLFDRIVTLADWSAAALLANGVMADRVSTHRIGTRHSPAPPAGLRPGGRPPWCGVFVGRVHASKGVGVVYDAVRRLARPDLEVDVYGPVAADTRSVAMASAAPPGVRIRGLLPDAVVVETIAQYDFVLVPSQILETGPFAVVEALQAGVPVIGSDLPGINELIRDGQSGLLVPPRSEAAWAAAIARLISDDALYARLKANCRFPRSMEDAAEEMKVLYKELVSRPLNHPSPELRLCR